MWRERIKIKHDFHNGTQIKEQIYVFFPLDFFFPLISPLSTQVI